MSGKLKEASNSTTFRPAIKTIEIADEFPVTESEKTTKIDETTTENIGDYKPTSNTVIDVYNTTYIWIKQLTTRKNIILDATEIYNREIATTQKVNKITDNLLTTTPQINEETTIEYDLKETSTLDANMHTTRLPQGNTYSPDFRQDTTIIPDSTDSMPAKIDEEMKDNTESNIDITTTESSLENETIRSTLIVAQVTEDVTLSNTNTKTTTVEERILEVNSQPNEMQSEISSIEIGTTLSSLTENMDDIRTEISTESSTVSLINMQEDYSNKQAEIVQNDVETTTITLEENYTEFIQKMDDSLNTTTVRAETNIEESEKENTTASTSATTQKVEKETASNLDSTTMIDSVTNHPVLFQQLFQDIITSTEPAEKPIMVIETDYTEPHLITNPPKYIIKDEVCNTVEAKKIASEMLFLMDHSVDACDDFYQFSCGGTEKEEKTNEHKMLDAISEALETQKTTSSSTDVKLFQEFYDQCYKYHTDAFDYKQRILNGN